MVVVTTHLREAVHPITVNPSNPFRIEVLRTYAAGEWLGSTSLASHDASKDALESCNALPLNSFG
jgi:hypothetical protein